MMNAFRVGVMERRRSKTETIEIIGLSLIDHNSCMKQAAELGCVSFHSP